MQDTDSYGEVRERSRKHRSTKYQYSSPEMRSENVFASQDSLGMICRRLRLGEVTCGSAYMPTCNPAHVSSQCKGEHHAMRHSDLPTPTFPTDFDMNSAETSLA